MKTTAQDSAKPRRRLATRAFLGAATAAAIAIPATTIPAASASTRATSAKVVERVNRKPIGYMLASAEAATLGRSLYILRTGTCTSSCLSSWPPLLMPSGATVPTGAKCLGIAGTGSTRQVTYHKKRLYMFSGDTGSSVNGNGLGGFAAAKITTYCP